MNPDCPILFTEHHQSHAASAFYPSPLNEAAILTIDGVGEWATTTIGVGRGHESLLKNAVPAFAWLLYSAFTSYCGFRINSGEYKLMGLAPYGEPKYREVIPRFADLSRRFVWLNLDYFDFLSAPACSIDRFEELFGGPPRKLRKAPCRTPYGCRALHPGRDGRSHAPVGSAGP